MISSDLTRDIKVSIKTAMGQLNYVLEQVDDEQQAGNILLQLKAVRAILDKAIFELLDDVYRKAMAEKISSAHQNCPGNCGDEDNIERLRRLFPEFSLEDVPQKLKEAEGVEIRLKKYLSEKNLDTPHP
ncbi:MULTISPECIES: metal-sensing transcriptional repressor [Flagellimonas]|uniref:Metal-sensitive transcriptional repressor n=2 Tax=Flagellimonas TaxID=444459 RepID=A0A1M6Y3D5_9FLAO|nr:MULTISPECIES: metal-sensing transcriptional repressor [Allomuricauda]NDV42372.1 metal-sensing transcriptional repressor [Allomuricauda sediminis]SFC05126.1 Metal-sensitive transcriptional repressor [Allomuricauda taeanensis]SHL12702.1 Metal-sensitive transcriptional repressor [Allomuricauda taeanensis]